MIKGRNVSPRIEISLAITYTLTNISLGNVRQFSHSPTWKSGGAYHSNRKHDRSPLTRGTAYNYAEREREREKGYTARGVFERTMDPRISD